MIYIVAEDAVVDVVEVTKHGYYPFVVLYLLVFVTDIQAEGMHATS